MAAAFQQQIFALDARFNAYRAPNNPNFKTLYIRRRSQLLRENAKFKDIETIKKYLHVRSQLLQRRYGVQDNISVSSASSRQRSSSKASLALDDFPQSSTNKKKNEMSISENYAFTGVHHIFDQHSEQVSVVKFANNDRSKLACASHDGSVSICDVTAAPPRVSFVLEGHTQPVTGCDWSASNELVVSVGLDGLLVVWDVTRRARLRAVHDQLRAPLLAVAFQPANNNMVIAGNARGMVEVLNVSTGIYPRGGSSILGGRVLSIACESSGRMFWAANDKGVIVSYRLEGAGGALSKLRRLCVDGAVTCLSWSPWLARHPALLASVARDELYLFRIADRDGTLALKKRFSTTHRSHSVKSTFCPIMSFRRGVCVVTGGEDATVYFLDIEGASAQPVVNKLQGPLALKNRFSTQHRSHSVKSTFCPIMSFRRGVCVVTGGEDATVYFLDIEGASAQPVVNKLQGHASPVLGVSFSYDESLLATSDASGLVIIWRRP